MQRYPSPPCPTRQLRCHFEDDLLLPRLYPCFGRTPPIWRMPSIQYNIVQCERERNTRSINVIHRVKESVERRASNERIVISSYRHHVIITSYHLPGTWYCTVFIRLADLCTGQYVIGSYNCSVVVHTNTYKIINHQ